MLKIVPRGELAFPMHKPKVEFDVALVQELHLQEGHPVGTTICGDDRGTGARGRLLEVFGGPNIDM